VSSFLYIALDLLRCFPLQSWFKIPHIIIRFSLQMTLRDDGFAFGFDFLALLSASLASSWGRWGLSLACPPSLTLTFIMNFIRYFLAFGLDYSGPNYKP